MSLRSAQFVAGLQKSEVSIQPRWIVASHRSTWGNPQKYPSKNPNRTYAVLTVTRAVRWDPRKKHGLPVGWHRLTVYATKEQYA